MPGEGGIYGKPRQMHELWKDGFAARGLQRAGGGGGGRLGRGARGCGDGDISPSLWQLWSHSLPAQVPVLGGGGEAGVQDGLPSLWVR